MVEDFATLNIMTTPAPGPWRRDSQDGILICQFGGAALLTTSVIYLTVSEIHLLRVTSHCHFDILRFLEAPLLVSGIRKL